MLHEGKGMGTGNTLKNILTEDRGREPKGEGILDFHCIPFEIYFYHIYFKRSFHKQF